MTPDARTVLTLVRHGQNRDNAEGRWQGRRDSPLTSEGRRQVEALSQRLARGSCATVYTSPLGRAVGTARLLSTAMGTLPIKTDARLTEYDCAWDGLTPSELRAQGFWEAVQRDPEFRPPQGEAFGASARRVVAAWQEFAAWHRGARVAVVGHGFTLASGLALLLDGDPRQAPRYTVDNAGIAELALDGRPTLIHIDPTIS